MPRFLVTGGAGFIGSHVVKQLVIRGEQVRVLDDFSSGHQRNIQAVKDYLDVVQADIRDFDAVKRAMKGVDVVFHLAAQGSVPRSISQPRRANEVNVLGTLNVLDAARDAGVSRFVFSSSSSVYGHNAGLLQSESIVPAPMSPYALTKLVGEHYCRLYSELYALETVCLRYFNVFGPQQDPHSEYAAVIPRFMEFLQNGVSPTIYGDGEQSRDFTFVDNVVNANLLAADISSIGLGAIYNVACGKSVSVNLLYELLSAAMSTDCPPQYIDSRPGELPQSKADISLIKTELGWTPEVFFEEGLNRTVAWFRESLSVDSHLVA